MRWVLWCMTGAILIAGGQALRAAHAPDRTPEVSLYGPTFKVGGLQFTIPSKWLVEPVENGNRAGQWRILPPRSQTGESAELVIFYFGKDIGGNARENVDAWNASMLTADGKPAAEKMTSHVVNGIKISQVVIFGTYSQPISVPGLPPQPKPKYGLMGAVVESPQGNIYWRFTGPDTLITANLPLFNKILSSVKPQDKIVSP